MAVTTITEHVNLQIPRGTVVKFTDGDAVDGYVFTLRYGSLTLTAGGFEIVRARDENGDFVGPARKGAQSGPSTMAISGKLFSTGGNASVPAFNDWLLQTSIASSALTTTEAAGGDFIALTGTVTFPNLGSNKGAVYSLASCIPQSGVGITRADDGWDVSFTVESPNAFPTVTENA